MKEHLPKQLECDICGYEFEKDLMIIKYPYNSSYPLVFCQECWDANENLYSFDEEF